MAVSGLMGKANFKGIRLEVDCPEEVYAGHPTLLRVGLHNGRRFVPGFLLEVRLGEQRLLFPIISPGATLRQSLAYTFPERGPNPVPELQLISRFPVNFFLRFFRLRLPREVLVFPRPIPCRIPASAVDGGAAGEAADLRRGFDGELRSIGDYHAGEPLKAIHWKLSARQDRLKVKEHSALTAPPVRLDLAALPGDLETRLSHACHLILQLLRGGRPVGLLLPGRDFPPAADRAHRMRLLGELARYGHH